VWCSYKYLNSGPGAAAGCFVHQRHNGNRDLPRLAGWWGHDPDTRFQMHRNLDFMPQGGAAGWQVSNPSILAMAPVKASLDMFDEVGMEALRAKSVKLTAYVEELLRRPGSDRFEILTPRDPAARGCQLSIRVQQQPKDVFAQLGKRGIVVDYREPDVIRVAPAPLYNTFEDAWVFADEFLQVAGVHPSGNAAGA
jgi:kynureninase